MPKLEIICAAGDANFDRDRSIEFVGMVDNKIYHLACVPVEMRQKAITLHVPSYSLGAKHALELNPYFEFEFRSEKLVEFEMETAIAEMLLAEIVEAGLGMDGYKMTEIMVGCNDIFAWGIADSEPLPAYEIRKLYEMWKADPEWGVQKWCCMHRNEKPQSPIAEDMKRDGAWDETMENLPQNTSELWYEFQTLAKQWHEDTAFLSNPSTIAEHPNCQKIIKMGKVAIPWILKDLEKNGGQWYIPLRQICLANNFVPPEIPEEDAGRIKIMNKIWLDWGNNLKER